MTGNRPEIKIQYMDVNCALNVQCTLCTATFQCTKTEKPALKTVYSRITFCNNFNILRKD